MSKFQQLIIEYPEFFSESFIIECGEGWYDLLYSMLFSLKHHQNNIQTIQKLYPERHIEYSSLKFLQIKEKFGCLRVYASGGDFYCRGVIDMTEHLSSKVCEITGSKGKIRSKKLDKDGKIILSWRKCLSDEEAIKQDYLINE